ncbi:MAG: saccharopine dehydrogenase NADP-binding domain-containing protein [Saprospiraceae bacterium]
MRILLIGGYGEAGRRIAEYALHYLKNIEIVIAGRNLKRAEQLAHDLNLELSTDRASARRVDVTNIADLTQAMREVDFVINASGTIRHTESVAKAILASKRDYLDMQLSTPAKLDVLKVYANDFKANDICVITDGGFHPGLPAAMIRYAAAQLDSLDIGNVYCAFKIDWSKLNLSDDTIYEFVEEFKNFDTTHLEDGNWVKPSWLEATARYEFGAPYGNEVCLPMYLEEFRELSKQLPALQSSGLFISGFNPVTDLLVTPLVMMGLKILPARLHKNLAQFFHWSLQFSKPPFGIRLIAECKGTKDEEPATLRISVEHEDGYVLTAIPVVACLKQYAENGLREAGLQFQATFVEPIEFLNDLAQMGLHMEKRLELPYKPRPAEVLAI